MFPKENLTGECVDCDAQVTYSKKPMQTHSELLKKHRVLNVGILH